MRRYKIVLTNHENFSVRVDGLISVLYLDVAPNGLILNCYKALASTSTYATGEVDRLLFDDSVPSAVIIQFVELDEHMVMSAKSAFAQNTLPVSSADMNHMVLSDSVPAIDVFMNLASKSSTLSIGSEFDESLLTVVQSLKTELAARLSFSATAFNDVVLKTFGEIITFIDSGELTVTTNIDGKDTSMRIGGNVAKSAVYEPYYVSDWADFTMADLADLTMAEMMYGEVVE